MSLIGSPRHTPADLAEWARNERLDAINAKRWAQRLQRKADEAAAHIVEFAEQGPCYVGCSWGKDSTVLAHIVASHAIDLPIVWVRVAGVENPDCPLVRDAFRALCNVDYHEIEAPAGDRRTSERGFAMAAERFGDRHVSGVRAEEAQYRALRMRRWGISTARTCAPIGWWSTAEVFAYLHAHGLPVHPAYACTGGATFAREHRRVGAIGGQRGTGHGRAEWEQRYYGS